MALTCPTNPETVERIESLRAALGASLDQARNVIETTRVLRDSDSMRRINSMRAIDVAAEAVEASVGLMR